MAAYLLITACLVAEPHTCSEIQVPDVVLEDVVSCSHKSREISKKWQDDHKDQYLVIAAKCVKAADGAGETGDAGKSDDGGTPSTPKQ